MPFPTYDDAVDVAQLQAAVAEMLGQRVKSGVHSFGTPGDNVIVSVNVTFPTPFASAPRVAPGLRNGVAGTNTQMVWATNATASGFTLNGKQTGGASLLATWIATDLPNS